MKQTIADSTFYIFFYDEIQDKNSLYHILKHFNMRIGPRVKYELRKHIEGDVIFSSIIGEKKTDVDFGAILKNFYEFLQNEFSDSIHDIKDGEYEVMGIAYLYKENGILDYLIIDDKYAFKFVKRNLPSIKENLIRTIGFLYAGYKKDNVLDKEFVIDILNKVENTIYAGKKPIYITEEIWRTRIKPTLSDLMEDCSTNV